MFRSVIGAASPRGHSPVLIRSGLGVRRLMHRFRDGRRSERPRHLHRGLRPIAGDHGGDAPDYGAGLFTTTSASVPTGRLLILVGAPHEDEARDGVP